MLRKYVLCARRHAYMYSMYWLLTSDVEMNHTKQCVAHESVDDMRIQSSSDKVTTCLLTSQCCHLILRT